MSSLTQFEFAEKVITLAFPHSKIRVERCEEFEENCIYVDEFNLRFDSERRVWIIEVSVYNCGGRYEPPFYDVVEVSFHTEIANALISLAKTIAESNMEASIERIYETGVD